MTRLEKYNKLMDTIDDYVEPDPKKDERTFRHFQGIVVKEFIATPDCVRVSQLKDFLALDVLKIFPRSASKVKGKTIKNNLEGKKFKFYSFSYEELDACFDPKANREAAERSPQMLAAISGLSDEELWADIPVYLLERIQDTFRIKLGEYWRMCDEDWIDGVDKSEQDKLKKDKYKECLAVLALHEIFVRKFTENRNTLMEELEKHNEIRGKLLAELEEIVALFRCGAKEKRKELEEQSEKLAQKGREILRWYSKFISFQALYLEHTIGLGAELQLAMLLEKKHLEEIEPSSKNKKEKYKIEKYLKFLGKYYLSGMENYNKNRTDYYGQLESIVEDTFVRIMNRLSETGQYDIQEAVEKYLEIVEHVKHGKADDEQRKKLWFAQRMIVIPLLCRDYA